MFENHPAGPHCAVPSKRWVSIVVQVFGLGHFIADRYGGGKVVGFYSQAQSPSHQGTRHSSSIAHPRLRPGGMMMASQQPLPKA